VQCLARPGYPGPGDSPPGRGTELWACSSEAAGFLAGTSTDDGRAFTARLHLRDIRGPLACAGDPDVVDAGRSTAGDAGDGGARGRALGAISRVAEECNTEWTRQRRELGLGDGPGAIAPRAGASGPPPGALPDAGAREAANGVAGAGGGGSGGWGAGRVAAAVGAVVVVAVLARVARSRRRTQRPR